MTQHNAEDDLKQAEAALEQKKAEYWIQYGVVLALRQLKEKEKQDGTNGGSNIPESGRSADSE